MLYKFNQMLKKQIKCLSIRQRMIISLIGCIIIPMLLLGLYTAIRIAVLSAQNQYEAQTSQLAKSAKELENLNTIIEQKTQSLSANKSIQAISDETASVIDYRNAADQLQQACAQIDYCSCIALIQHDTILFQRGDLYLSNFSMPNNVPNYTLSWWSPSTNVCFRRGITTQFRNELIYTTTLLDTTYQKKGAICVFIDIEKLLESLVPSGAENENIIENVLVYNETGNVLLEKESAQTNAKSYWNMLISQDSLSNSGYFSKTPTSRQIILYAKCENVNWYLIQTMNRLNIYDTQFFFILGVLIFCLLFGIVYGIIQDKTILTPLRRLSNRINIVKTGVLEKESYETAHDEIGNVERGFEDMVDHINDLINQVYLQTIKTKDAEREMLLTKMNPHFLYNSLDSIHWLAFRNKDYEVSEQLESLAGIYRHILQFDTHIITIRQEIEFIKNYIFLLKCQIGDRIQFKLDVSESIYSYKIPKLLLQPLIENAVNHGLKTVQHGVVKIRIQKRESTLVIIVIDNGIGCNTRELTNQINRQDSEKAFALRNINERVCLTYGDEYGLKIYSGKHGGFMAKITIKAEEEFNETIDCR